MVYSASEIFGFVIRIWRQVPFTALTAVAALALSLYQFFWPGATDSERTFDDQNIEAQFEDGNLRVVLSSGLKGEPSPVTAIVSFVPNGAVAGDVSEEVITLSEPSYRIESGRAVYTYPGVLAQVCRRIDKSTGDCGSVRVTLIRIQAEFAWGPKSAVIRLEESGV